MPIETSSIPAEVQLETLAFLLRDKEVMSHFVETIREEHFENPVHRIIYRVAKAYFVTYIRSMPKSLIERELGTYIQEHRRDIIGPPEFFWRELEKIFAIQIVERQYLIDKVNGYLLRAELAEMGETAIREAGREQLNMTAVSGSINKLFRMISGRGRSQKVEYLLKDSQNRVRENPAIAKIPTGFRVFDSVLGGGLGAGELGICLAPTSVGKSFWLNSVGAHALKLRRKIFQITLEISVRKVIARYESLLTRVPKARLHIQSETVSRALDRARRLVEEADIRVQEFPIRSLSVDELRALLTQTITVEEFMPDLIIIDYADIMKPIVRSREEKRYESLGAIYEGLRAIAQEFDVPLWSASQANKRSIGRPYVTLADMAESFAKAQTADVVIALCKTQAETQQHRGRFFVAKNRDNPSNIVIPFREDFDIGRFEEAENAHPEEVNPTETEYSEGEPGTHNEDENVPF